MVVARKKKQFFFEKKNQETYIRSYPRRHGEMGRVSNEQKFFGSFFQKRTASRLFRNGHLWSFGSYDPFAGD